MATRTPLSRDRVLTAAVALADREGIAALTMRRLAADLGVEAMSLYHHLPAKQALLDGVVETVLAEFLGTPPDVDDWRARLRGQFLAARAVMLRHPWAPGLIAAGRSVPPSVFAYYDGILATLVAGGFSYHLAHRALHAFGSMPLGFVQEVFSPDAGGDKTDADLEAMAAALPHITAMVASEIHDAGDPTLGWCDSQTEFEFTLDLLLDGLERLRQNAH
ncbi:TetR/AcrR family transcriptional regulator C-terminal domain-containing protein [Actinoplanes bogorensis]|uniref:TetR/AcrR family transcriptional regulator C-terminal domain-containing protein n=1 Tax=Paractinoplanes bogorensis TaxID=1610840 RepID=A0ABS5YP47_9ACTN|nr:TetR/AcrR family transcriptional regulator C-terminal domain-containing protein [Actinoplanes bogorensis]MBU2665234.1 TetR/AcrR family transcriptional regulator C-terminal domain-containing protein [Actinoplanes bogorensis]